MNNSTDRAELRKRLLANGYRPLPLLDKGIRIKGWSTVEIDDDWLAQYARSGRYKNTGIRCDDLIAFDIDVNDEDLADDIEEKIEKICGPSEYCRVGRWPRRLLLYRLVGDPIRSARSGKFDSHQVELLAGSGRQFAAFGIHPSTGEPYKWEGLNPQYHGIDKVPELEGWIAKECMERIEQLFDSRGYRRDTEGSEYGRTGAIEYDLLPGTLVEVDGNEMTWAELKPQLTEKGVFGNIEREDGTIGDSDGVKFQLAKGSGQPIAHDFPRDVTHHEAMVAIAIPDAPQGALFTAPVIDQRDALEVLIDDYVLFYDQTVRMVAEPTFVMQLAGFKTATKHEWVRIIKADGTPKDMQAVDAWVNNFKTKRAHVAQLRPDHPREVMLHQGKRVVFNTYREPQHPDRGGEIELFIQFLTHLIPSRAERELFLDWLALKVINPSWRMHGFVMVTKEFGTGRGTLFQIVEKLFGMEYVKSMDYDDLIGHTSQSTYNDYFADSLIVTVGEVFEKTEHKSDWEARKIAYERLKSICEPIARPMHIKRKYGRNSTEMVYASLLVSSNHDDALAIEPGDRRLIVIDNTTTRLVDVPQLDNWIHRWHEDPANLGRLYRWLGQRAIDGVRYDPFGAPPDTAAKRRMVDAGQSDLDHLFDWFLDECKGDVCVHYQWEQFARRKQLESDELELPSGDKLKRGMLAIMAKRGVRFDHLGNRQMRIDGKRERPWIIRNFEHWKCHEIAADIAAEVLKNGPVQADVTPLKPER